jgi:hypothetical protein
VVGLSTVSGDADPNKNDVPSQVSSSRVSCLVVLTSRTLGDFCPIQESRMSSNFPLLHPHKNLFTSSQTSQMTDVLSAHLGRPKRAATCFSGSLKAVL